MGTTLCWAREDARGGKDRGEGGQGCFHDLFFGWIKMFLDGFDQWIALSGDSFDSVGFNAIQG